VPSLVSLAGEKMAASSDDNAHLLRCLPMHLKDTIRIIQLKRGFISDSQFDALLHDGVEELEMGEFETLSEAQVRSISSLKRLRKLDLNGVAIAAPETILERGLMNLSCLRILYLRATGVGDRVAAAIGANCPFLVELDLGHCVDVGDAGVTALSAGCKKLSCLNLSKTGIADSGLAVLGENCRESLRELRIDGCLRVTDDGVERLLAGVRRLAIFVFHNCPKLTDRSRLAVERHDTENKMKQLVWTVY
jgi:hypothetical protein